MKTTAQHLAAQHKRNMEKWPPHDRTGLVADGVYEEVLFRDYSSFDSLPGICKSDNIRAEFERYKAWERGELTQ